MSVNINQEELIEYNSDDLVLEEFSIMEGIKGFVESLLPADVSYFDHSKIDQVFRELDRNDAKSEDYAFVISSIIVNIGSAARQPSSLEKCYKKNLRYRGTVLYYFNKYKGKLSDASKKKIRHSIERQFKHFQINPIKSALKLIKVGGAPIGELPAKILKLSSDSISGGAVNSLVDTYSGWLAIKYYDLLEAIRMYKRAANSEYDIGDPKSMYVSGALKKEAEYFYQIAYAVLQDMLKVYDEL